MKCPQCGALVAPKTAICPKCDHVLDASAFSSAPPTSHREQDTPPEGTPTPAARAARPPVRTARSGQGSPARAPGSTPRRNGTAVRSTGAPSRRPAPVIDDDDHDTQPPKRSTAHDDEPDTAEIEEEDWHPKPVPMPARPTAKARADDSLGIGYAPAEDLMQEAKFFLRDLSGADRFAFWGGALTFFACFFPWKQTAAEGDTLGFLSIGVLVLVLSLLLCGSIWVRERGLMPRVSAATTWYLQFVCAALAPLWTLICIKLSWNAVLVRATVGTEDIWVSKPGFGAIIALPLSIVALLGTLMSMKGKR